MTDNKDEKSPPQKDQTDKTNPSPPHVISFNIHEIIYNARSKNGIKTEDYDVYRKYCTKQISTLRKKYKVQCLDPSNDKTTQISNRKSNILSKIRAKKIKNGKIKIKRDPKWNPKYKKNKDKNKKILWKNREITINDIKKNPFSLLILLYLCERCWVYSKYIYQDYDDDHSRKYHHSNNKLRKAIKYCNYLYNLLIKNELQLNIDCNTIVQVYSYLSWLKSCYYLQIEDIPNAYYSYLSSIKSVSNQNQLFYFLENNSQNNVNNKLFYFKSQIKKKDKLIKIENNVNQVILQLKNKLNIVPDADANDVDDDADGRVPDDVVYVEFDSNKVAVPAISNLDCNITGFCNKLLLISDDIPSIKLFNEILIILQKCLFIIKNENELNNELEIIQKYLKFNQFKYLISKYCLWLFNRMKYKNKNDYYSFGCLCEFQIKYLDELSCFNLIDSAEIEILRNGFEILRMYFIANIYYSEYSEYNKSYLLLINRIIPQSNDYLNKFNYKKDKNNQNQNNLSHLIDIQNIKIMIQNVLNDSKKLVMLSKANGLMGLDKDDGGDDDVDDDIPFIFDINRKLYPLLSKPIMIDIAWNYVDYPDEFQQQSISTDTSGGADASKQKQTGWFGGIFGR